MEQQGHMRAVEDEGKETATNSHEDLPQQVLQTIFLKIDLATGYHVSQYHL